MGYFSQLIKRVKRDASDRVKVGGEEGLRKSADLKTISTECMRNRRVVLAMVWRSNEAAASNRAVAGWVSTGARQRQCLAVEHAKQLEHQPAKGGRSSVRAPS